MKHPKIKLYTHHNTHTLWEDAVQTKKPSAIVKVLLLPFTLAARICFGAGMVIVKTATLVLGIVTKFCYLFGLALVYPITLLKGISGNSGKFVENEIQRTVSSLEEKWQRLTSRELAFTLIVFGVLSSFAVGSVNLAKVVAEGLELKGRVLGQTNEALVNLEQGTVELAQQDISGARQAFDKALRNFRQSRSDIREASSILRLGLNVMPQSNAGNNLLEAGSLLTESATLLTSVYENGKQLKFSPTGLIAENGSNTVPLLLENIYTDVILAQEKVSKANSLLANTDSTSLPQDKREQFTEAQVLVNQASQSLTLVRDLVALSRNIFVGEKHILVLFQNNNELRPTGGFPGTFGRILLKDGSIQELHVSSIYDLDGQLQEQIAPPFPVLMVNGRWYLRDANWFADFPKSAKVISEFYYKESKQSADIIVSLTPNVVTNLLDITGPIDMPAYGIQLSSSNFVEVTQVETSLNYDKLENKPKAMLGDFMTVFLERLSNLEGIQKFAALGVLQNNLAAGDVLMYSANPELQKQLSGFHWTGELEKTDRDFLLVIGSNLNGHKIDSAISQDLSLQTNISLDGTITNTLSIVRTNPLPGIEDMTSLQFMRIYVPEGSVLMSSTGFSKPPANFDSLRPQEAITHPEIVEWEKSAVTDVSSGAVIGKESGKTFFGNWITVAGGEQTTASITYRLPFKLGRVDRLSLLFQKQPGANPSHLEYEVNYAGRTAHWKNFKPITISPGKLSLEIAGDRTTFLGMVLEKAE